MHRSTRDALLDALEGAAGGGRPSPPADGRDPVLEALEAEGLVELRAGAYHATAAGLKALEERGRTPHLSGQVAVLFTDFVGSTLLMERFGDSDAHAILRRHFELLRFAVREHAGREIKSLGDGLMVVFARAADAVACAATMQAAVAREGGALALRIGIHVGEPVREGNDYFGTPVILARRLCDIASAGQTLVSDSARQLVPGWDFESVGEVPLKGLRDPVPASAVAAVRPRRGELTGLVAVAG